MSDNQHAIDNAKAWLESIEEMMGDIQKAEEVGDGRAADEARERVQESVLSVEVRSGWCLAPMCVDERGKPEEYKILLTTGGQALRIIGGLSEHGEPESASMEWQDWGTPWTRYAAPETTLLAFAQQFYFGE